MTCQRCGDCCISMWVIIRVDDRLKAKPAGRACPFLSFNGQYATCGVHDRLWFVHMPCHVYGNSAIDPDFAHRKGKPCQVGELIQQHGGLKDVEWATTDSLEDLGPVPEELDADT